MHRMILTVALAWMVSFGAPQIVYSMDKKCVSTMSKEVKDKIIAMAEKSKKDKKGLTIYLSGQSVAVVVTELIGTELIVGKNREYDQVMIRVDQISGLAMN